ncbi:hypothetical protein [Bradyrhizobium sp. CCBAU 45384]|nr:hypothetical protein [Bradyrhizobium sp. CCBAU 45384]
MPRLSVTTDKAKIKALIKYWLDQGSLIEVRRKDPKRRDERSFIEVAEPD